MTTHPRDTEDDRPGTRPRRSDRASTGTGADRLKGAVAVVVGSVLVVRGLRRRSLRGAAMALAGGGLLARALGGRLIGRRSGPRAADRHDAGRTGATDTTSVSRSITVGKPADELYEAWRDPERFSRIVGHFADVTSLGDGGYRWTVDGPGGRDLSWETHIVEEESGEFLRWETPEDATVSNRGSVRFHPAPGDRGTVVTMTVTFDPPGGRVGNAALKRLGIVPETLVGQTLGRFKSLVESGEIPTLEGNPSARGRGDLL